MKIYLLVIVLLSVIGLIVHSPSFEMSLYGDEWIDVYEYESGVVRISQVSSLPGPLKYLTPYGFGVFLIGSLYQVFGTNYSWYFVTSLLFKVFAAFSMYLVYMTIPINKSTSVNKRRLLSFLSAILLLVGYTGIENTDWTHYMHIYLANGLFLLTIYSLIKFTLNPRIKFVYWCIFLSGLSLIIGTVRVFPMVFILPLFTTYLYISNKDPKVRRLIMMLGGAFVGMVLILWGTGLFGDFFIVYSYGDWSFAKFITAITGSPSKAIESLLYWVGSVIIPDMLMTNQKLIIGAGMLAIWVYLIAFFKNIKGQEDQEWKFLTGSLFFIFILSHWFYLPTTVIGSAHRYLLLTFSCFIIWIFSIGLSTRWAGVLIAILIIIHSVAVLTKYDLWLGQGRSSAYIHQVDAVLSEDFHKPLIEKNIIYLEADDGSFKHSTIFGLAVKIMVFSKTHEDRFMPNTIDDKSVLVKKVGELIDLGINKETALSRVYAYRIKDKKFTKITLEVREELKQILLQAPGG